MHDAQERELTDNPMADHSEVYGAMIHAVADWMQQRSGTIANGSQWAEILREEASR